MCFSAEASFTAGAILSAGGIVLLRKYPFDKRTLLALIPLIFGIQQISEGVLWLSLESGAYPSTWGDIAKNFFLFIAYMLWPVWSPLAFSVAETVLWRKMVMWVCLILGLIIAITNIYLASTQNWTATIVEHSINYGPSHILKKILYAFVVIVPYIVSSIPKAWISGIAIGIAFVIADCVYNYAQASVWCFEAAIISIGLYFTLKQTEKRTEERT